MLTTPPRSNRLKDLIPTPNKLTLQGLSAGPSQVWGSVRLVPLIRAEACETLRIASHALPGPAHKQVVLDGEPSRPKTTYCSYIPHGLILTQGGDAREAQVSWQSRLAAHAKLANRSPEQFARAGKLHRIVKRLDRSAVRMLPMHLALEGFLALHFGGPDVAYSYYSDRSLRHGLTPRVEYGLSGWSIPDLGHALSRFEIHEGQCGVLIYVADALASAFVVSHPEDYRRLHLTVLEDMYAELFWYYGQCYGGVPAWKLDLEEGDEEEIESLEDLERACERAREELARFEVMVMGEALIERRLHKEKVYRLKAFMLERFMTDIEDRSQQGNYIGERIVSKEGDLCYLKVFRLSREQERKARLLKLLADHEWNLYDASHASGTPLWQLKGKIVQAGFGYILRHGSRTAL